MFIVYRQYHYLSSGGSRGLGLSGVHPVVTGGSKGVGSAVADGLAAEDAPVAVMTLIRGQELRLTGSPLP